MEACEQTYVPSCFTLTKMEGFGKQKKKHIRPVTQKIRQRQYSLSFIPTFSKKVKPIYDKENLLDQLQKQNRKTKLIIAQNHKIKTILLKKTENLMAKTEDVISKTDQKDENKCQKNNNKIICIRNQSEIAMQIFARNKAQIMKIKLSKKYNKFAELMNHRDICKQQLKEVKNRYKQIKFEYNNQRRIKKNQKRRRNDMLCLNRQIEQSIETQNNEIMFQIEEISAVIAQNKNKSVNLNKERERLLKQIKNLHQILGLKQNPFLQSNIAIIVKEGNDLKGQNECKELEAKYFGRESSEEQNESSASQESLQNEKYQKEEFQENSLVSAEML